MKGVPCSLCCTDYRVVRSPCSKVWWFKKLERLEDKLILKVGARVVLAKNVDVENGWLNGTLATVLKIHNNSVTIQNIKNGRKTLITKARQNLGFKGCSAQFIQTQFPLILGWALTVHKVQGMTLERAYLQLNDSFFASGQAYVALSRVKTIENLHLLEYDRSAIYLEDYYRSLINWTKSVNLIRKAVKHSI